MGSDAAVADAGETLVALLRDRMADLLPPEDVALASPGDRGGDAAPRLTLFLYRVEADEHRRTAAPAGATVDRLAGAPLVLELGYLLTAHPTPADDPATRSRDQQRVLGRAMGTLRDNAVVAGSDLRGSLAGDEPLRVTLVPNATGEALDVWSTFDATPYQPSATYVVGPVTIASRRDAPVSRVVERRTGPDDEGAPADDASGDRERDGDDAVTARTRRRTATARTGRRRRRR